jgi:hypothetical protein
MNGQMLFSLIKMPRYYIEGWGGNMKTKKKTPRLPSQDLIDTQLRTAKCHTARSCATSAKFHENFFFPFSHDFSVCTKAATWHEGFSKLTIENPC